MVAKVAVEGLPYFTQGSFDYLVPDGLRDRAVPGARVTVPFGRGGKSRKGIVLSTSEHSGYAGPLKEILSAAADRHLLSGEMLTLAQWMGEKYLCPVYDCVRAMLPAGLELELRYTYELCREPDAPDPLQAEIAGALRAGPVSEKKLGDRFGPEGLAALQSLVRSGAVVERTDVKRAVGDNTVAMAELACTPEQLQAYLSRRTALTEKHRPALEFLLQAGACEESELTYRTGASAAMLKTLEKRGLIARFRKEVLRTPYAAAGGDGPAPDAPLSERQMAVADAIDADAGTFRTHLLYGVTGSGKTHVFYELIDRTLRRGRDVIVLVPEILLTVQMVSRIKSRYGGLVAVMHSNLSAGERLDEWKRMKLGLAKIAVGTRTAVFAPFDNIGLIIIDEEQAHTYKSEMSPRYAASAVAKQRAAAHGAALVLSSATPALESYFFASQGRYRYHELPARYNRAAQPPVHIVDLRDELRNGNASVLSLALQRELAKNLDAGEQSILFINRRGYNTFVSCRACGYVAKCPSCGIAMTYHLQNNRLMCHYCGHSEPTPSACPECGSSHIRYFGAGTQKAQEDIQRLFPQARVLRMDADTTARKYAHDEMLAQFAAGGYDILLGTQMVTKGLDFGNVTLVGILAADASLYTDDFRANERTFSLITQATGRAGRGDRPGRAVIQAYTPDSPVLSYAASQDYKGFYQQEISLRKALRYPPFADVCQAVFTGKDPARAMEAAKWCMERVQALAGQNGLPVIGIGPAPCAVAKLRDDFRIKFLLKCRADRAFRDMLRQALREYSENKTFREIDVWTDVNPYTIQ